MGDVKLASRKNLCLFTIGNIVNLALILHDDCQA